MDNEENTKPGVQRHSQPKLFFYIRALFFRVQSQCEVGYVVGETVLCLFVFLLCFHFISVNPTLYLQISISFGFSIFVTLLSIGENLHLLTVPGLGHRQENNE